MQPRHKATGVCVTSLSILWRDKKTVTGRYTFYCRLHRDNNKQVCSTQNIAWPNHCKILGTDAERNKDTKHICVQYFVMTGNLLHRLWLCQTMAETILCLHPTKLLQDLNRLSVKRAQTNKYTNAYVISTYATNQSRIVASPLVHWLKWVQFDQAHHCLPVLDGVSHWAVMYCLTMTSCLVLSNRDTKGHSMRLCCIEISG